MRTTRTGEALRCSVNVLFNLLVILLGGASLAMPARAMDIAITVDGTDGQMEITPWVFVNGERQGLLPERITLASPQLENVIEIILPELSRLALYRLVVPGNTPSSSETSKASLTASVLYPDLKLELDHLDRPFLALRGVKQELLSGTATADGSIALTLPPHPYKAIASYRFQKPSSDEAFQIPVRVPRAADGPESPISSSSQDRLLLTPSSAILKLLAWTNLRPDPPRSWSIHSVPNDADIRFGSAFTGYRTDVDNIQVPNIEGIVLHKKDYADCFYRDGSVVAERDGHLIYRCILKPLQP